MARVTSSPRWFQNQVLSWYRQHGRQHLPWKKVMNPYRVWVSEIMLQQTQVATVIPYFLRFMKSFPTVTKLSEASLDEVLSHWAGLGYYARGRNLHKTATMIVENFAGQFPSSVEELLTLPGIGLSTAGAIVAQAFDKRATICDGNVKRVLSRFHCVKGVPTEKKVESILWEWATHYTPHQEVGEYTQAMMDIGATICTRSAPKCEVCPLNARCQANLENKQMLFPEKKSSKALPNRIAFMLCAFNRTGELLLQKRPLKGIWGGLWSLPEFSTQAAMKDFIVQKLGAKSATLLALTELKHTFTHYHLHIRPTQIEMTAKKCPQLPNYHWVNSVEIKQLGLPAPIKKIINYDSMSQKQRTL